MPLLVAEGEFDERDGMVLVTGGLRAKVSSRIWDCEGTKTATKKKDARVSSFVLFRE